MAENKDGQERTEEATPKRRQDAREKGQVPRSRELNTFVMMLISAAALLVLGDDMMVAFTEIGRQGLTMDRNLIFNPTEAIAHFGHLIVLGLGLCLPFFLLNLVGAIASSVALGGLSFSAKAMAFKWEKLDPIAGFKRLFAVRGLVELLKAVAKFLLVGTVGVMLLWHFRDQFLTLGYQSVSVALGNAGEMLAWSFLLLAAVLVLVAIADAPFQIWDHGRQLKMTRQEVRDEMKDMEGKPEVKGRMRQMQREMSQRRMMEAVPDADVVVTNPTHFAVALKYDENMRAPRVVAKGADTIAAQIRARAIDSNVPLFSAPPLARALYHSTEIDQEIPAGLYLGVAQVLAYVYQLQNAHPQAGVTQPDIPVPDEYYYPPQE